jgi:hypothetical protein
MPEAERHPVSDSRRLPFDLDFQKSLLRLIAEDDVFGSSALVHLYPQFFDDDILGWICGFMRRFFETHAAIPSLAAVLQEAGRMDSAIRDIYGAMVHEVQKASLRDEIWLRGATLDFVRRNVFVSAFQESRVLYNAGKVTEAYDLMMGRMEDLGRVGWESISEEWLFDDLQKRHTQRVISGPGQDAIPTGFPSLDHVLGGGLHPGELGVWMAYAKVGKTTLLINHGVAACRRQFKVLHVVLEGSLGLIVDRYDSAFLRESYREVKTGTMDPKAYALALKEYQYFKGTCVVRSFVDQWDISVLDIDSELRRLERNHGWKPDLIIIDYADLMTGRERQFYRTETESQRAAYRDIKRLAGRGYGVWTASQARRPSDKQMETAHILFSNSAADTYEKVRVADFWGSLNQTNDEKTAKTMRLYYEMYRDNAAGILKQIRADSDKMWMHEDPQLQVPNPVVPSGGKQEAAW